MLHFRRGYISFLRRGILKLLDFRRSKGICAPFEARHALRPLDSLDGFASRPWRPRRGAAQIPSAGVPPPGTPGGLTPMSALPARFGPAPGRPPLVAENAVVARAEREFADRAAIKFGSDRQWNTHAEYFEESCRFAALFLERLPPDGPRHVAVLLDNTPDYLFALAGSSSAAHRRLNQPDATSTWCAMHPHALRPGAHRAAARVVVGARRKFAGQWSPVVHRVAKFRRRRLRRFHQARCSARRRRRSRARARRRLDLGVDLHRHVDSTGRRSSARNDALLVTGNRMSTAMA